MEKEYLKTKIDNLFKKFYAIDSRITWKFGGTGLGLVICKGIVELMVAKFGLTEIQKKERVLNLHCNLNYDIIDKI